ncbi:hypothetical protein [Peribacillus asahii]|uniref:hypothetical protein n=1 Tax=Peribacillus asahii TaxID=228899 RepID=UPI00207AD030|nr:hypothetical protein [Peribacillus asahii]USK62173.1 hypothetical protein LIT37_23640 [Peribacillus asahii]
METNERMLCVEEQGAELYTKIGEAFNYQVVLDLCNRIKEGGLEYRYMLLHYMYSSFDLFNPINQSLLQLADLVEEDIAIRE